MPFLWINFLKISIFCCLILFLQGVSEAQTKHSFSKEDVLSDASHLETLLKRTSEFKEVKYRGFNRYKLVLENDFVAGFLQDHKRPWLDTVMLILGCSNFGLTDTSVIISKPSSQDQKMHLDGPGGDVVNAPYACCLFLSLY